MIQHRDIGSDGGWMAVGHVDRATAQFDVLGFVRNARQENQIVGDVLGQIGDMLPT